MSEKSSSSSDPMPAVSFSYLLNSFLQSLLQAVRDFIHFSLRNKILILLAVVVGIVTGVVNYKMTPRFYKVSMLVSSTGLPLKVYSQMLNNLNSLAETGTNDILSKSLNLDAQTAQNIRSIALTNMDGTDIRKDTSSKTDNSSIIQMTIRDNRIADTLSKALVYYFNNNEYLHKLKQDQVQLRLEKLEFLTNELRRMDSLKDAYNRSLVVLRNAPSFYNNALDPAKIYEQSDIYAKEKMEVEEWLLQKRLPLVTIDGVKPTIAPSSTSITQSVLIFTVIFYLIGCMLAVILEIAKRVVG